jgi:flavin-dependent dehydrogenase
MIQIASRTPALPAPRRIAVVGASTSGLFAAMLLAEQGLSVRVYEANPTLDFLSRTLIVTSCLPDVLGFLPIGAVVNEVDYFELISEGCSSRVNLRRPDLIVERERLLRLLAERAQKAGVELVLDRRLVSIDRGTHPNSHPVTLRFEGEAGDQLLEERADAVIRADGVGSQVSAADIRRRAGDVSLVQALVEPAPDSDPRGVRVWFDRGTTRFFCWLIPESKRRAVVGLISDDAGQARAVLDSFLADRGLEPLEYQAAPVAVHGYRSAPWADYGGGPVLRVGDAAGQVKMTTVGGLVTGLRGARAAAEAILEGVDYRRQLHGLKRELDVHLLLRDILDRFSNADYDVLLHCLNRRLLRVLESRSRDEMARAFWSLPLAQPRLLYLAARVLLRRRRR